MNKVIKMNLQLFAEKISIFDFVTATEVAAYWTSMTKDKAPYLGEEIFPNQKKLGLDLKWIKGSNGAPVVLKPSAYDVTAVPRARIKFDELSAEMPFFKESMYINEEVRQELNKVIETGNQAYIDAVLNRVFSDDMTLLRGAAAQRERIRMMALTSGVVDISANGQAYSYDYGIPTDHKATVAVSWSDPLAPIIEDIRTAQDKIEEDTGEKPTRALCSSKTWQYLRKNTEIKKSIFVLSDGQGTVSDLRLKAYLLEELGLEIVVYSKRYKDEKSAIKKFIPDDTFVLMPMGALGTTWLGTTPEESDLMSSAVANVSIVDTGVAITTTQKTDPVNVETKVTMICLPSFEKADHVFILDSMA